MKVLRHKNKHVILISAILLLACGLLAGAFLFQSNNRSPQFAFSPTPTVVPTPKEYRKIQPAGRETESWLTFINKSLQFSIKHPKNIILDKRQTSEGRITVFIFDEDKPPHFQAKSLHYI